MVFRAECHAKVNLFLAVGPNDASGYHPLRSIFQSVTLSDGLEVEVGVAATSWEIADPSVPAENTLTKTLRLFREYTDAPELRVRLSKRIPPESGLGGGSSDAGRFLAILDLATGHRLAQRELGEIAAAVGADVPYFLVGGRARVEGYGERVSPLDDLEPLPWMVLARPPVGCSTPAMYRALDHFQREWRDYPESGETPINDFEQVAPPECLRLKAALMALGASSALMTGSGSAVFGMFADEGAAAVAAKRLEAAVEARTWVARATARSEFSEIERCASRPGS